VVEVTGGGDPEVRLGGALMSTSFLALTSGPVMVTFGRSFGSSFPVGASWSASVQDLGTDEFGDDLSSATLVAQSPIAGSIQHGGDVDVIAFDAQPDHFYLAASTFGAVGTEFTVLDATGAVIAPQFQARGRVHLRLRSWVGRRYLATVTDLGLDDHPAPAGTELPLDGGWVSGAIQTGYDRDVFALAAQPGALVRVRLESLLDGGVLEADLSSQPLGVVALAPDELASSGFLLDAATTLTVRGNAVVPYRVAASLVRDDFDDATTFALTAGASQAGRLDWPGDRDRFSFVASAGDAVDVALSPSSGANARVIAPGGQVVPPSFIATTSGTYEIEVSRTNQQGLGIVSYSVRFSVQ
jgi:hypothetical protein